MRQIMEMGMADLDPEIYGLTKSELSRQRDGVELIASENFVPRAVMEAQGSILTKVCRRGTLQKYYGGAVRGAIEESPSTAPRSSSGRIRQRPAHCGSGRILWCPSP